jgi:hypothetical protein
MGILTGKASAANSIPSYNGKFEEWIQFHKDLDSNFGKKIANSLWIKAWKIRGISSANTNELRSYMEKQGVKIDKSSWDSLVDAGDNVTDAFGTAFQVTKFVGIGIAVIVVGGLAMIVFNLAKSPAKNIGVATRAFVTKGK